MSPEVVLVSLQLFVRFVPNILRINIKTNEVMMDQVKQDLVKEYP